MDPSWWETSNIISPNFKCEIEQGLVRATLSAREIDVLGNDVITRLISHGNLQQNFLPSVTQHICVTLTIDTPSLSHEYDSIKIRIREIEVIIRNKKSEIDSVRNLIHNNDGNVEEYSGRLALLRGSLHNSQMELCTAMHRKSKIKERVTALEKIRCSKIFHHLVNFFYYHFHVDYKDSKKMCIFDNKFSAISLRQLHDVSLVYLNFIKHTCNYNRDEFHMDDDGIDVLPTLPSLNVNDVDHLIDDDDNDVPPRLFNHGMGE